MSVILYARDELFQCDEDDDDGCLWPAVLCLYFALANHNLRYKVDYC